tara:strand:+ start:919 stop:1026 length:108 start_codon:yes stop_codon:yes gene_type:complete
MALRGKIEVMSDTEEAPYLPRGGLTRCYGRSLRGT